MLVCVVRSLCRGYTLAHFPRRHKFPLRFSFIRPPDPTGWEHNNDGQCCGLTRCCSKLVRQLGFFLGDGSVLYFVVAVVVLVDRAKEGLVIGYITHIGCFNWKQFKKHTKHSVRYALFLPAGGTQRRGWMVEKLLSKAHTFLTSCCSWIKSIFNLQTILPIICGANNLQPHTHTGELLLSERK